MDQSIPTHSPQDERRKTSRLSDGARLRTTCCRSWKACGPTSRPHREAYHHSPQLTSRSPSHLGCYRSTTSANALAENPTSSVSSYPAQQGLKGVEKLPVDAGFAFPVPASWLLQGSAGKSCPSTVSGKPIRAVIPGPAALEIVRVNGM